MTGDYSELNQVERFKSRFTNPVRLMFKEDAHKLKMKQEQVERIRYLSQDGVQSIFDADLYTFTKSGKEALDQERAMEIRDLTEQIRILNNNIQSSTNEALR